MSDWIRLYYDTINDPKINQLSLVDQRHYFCLLCLHARDGVVTSQDAEIASHLRITKQAWLKAKSALKAVGLIDDNATIINLSNLKKRGDSSKQRTIKYRNSKKNKELVTEIVSHCDVTESSPERDSDANVTPSPSSSLPPFLPLNNPPLYPPPISNPTPLPPIGVSATAQEEGLEKSGNVWGRLPVSGTMRPELRAGAQEVIDELNRVCKGDGYDRDSRAVQVQITPLLNQLLKEGRSHEQAVSLCKEAAKALGYAQKNGMYLFTSLKTWFGETFEKTRANFVNGKFEPPPDAGKKIQPHNPALVEETKFCERKKIWHKKSEWDNCQDCKRVNQEKWEKYMERIRKAREAAK